MEVELPDGRIAEFPDDMPHEKISAVLQKQFPVNKKNSSNKSSVNDISSAKEQIQKRFPGMPNFLVNALMPTAVKMAESKPVVNEGTATGAFLRSAVRSPLEGAENLAQLIGLPVDKKSQWPSLISESKSDQDHAIAQMAGSLAGFAVPAAGSISALRSIPAWGNIVQKAAPSLLRRAPVHAAEGAALGAAFSPKGQRGKGALTGAVLGVALSSIPSISKGFSSLIERFSALRNLDKLREEGKISDEQYKQTVSNEDNLKEFARNQGIGTDSMRLEAELPELKSQESKLLDEVKSIPKENLSNRLPSPKGEQLVPEAERVLQGHENRVQSIEHNLSEQLGFGQAHDVRIARKLNQQIKNKKKEIGSIYENVKSDLKDSHVVLPRGREVTQINNELIKAIQEGGYGSEEVKKLATELESVQKGKNDLVPANEFLEMYRSTRSLANKAMSNSRKEGMDALERRHWEKQHQELSSTAEKMNELLESHMGQDLYNNLQRANYRWRNEITPLYGNKHYYQIKEGKLPKDIMSSLRGDNSGNVLIKNMIKADPELVTNVLGQKYARNPSKIYDFDELSQEYIDEVPPELRETLSQYLGARENLTQSRNSLSSAQQNAKRMESESERVSESFKEKKKEQSVRSKKEKELNEIRSKIENYERIIPELKNKSKSKNLSLQKKLEIESKIDKAEKDKQKLITRLLASGFGVGSYLVGKNALAKILKP